MRVDLGGTRDFTALMRVLFASLIILVVTTSGCFWHRAKGREGVAGGDSRFTTPETALVGRVVRINAGARFAVLNFPVGQLPSLDQRLSVYREGLKVGEIKVTGPQLDDNIVGDIIAGEVRVGDELRDR